MTIPIITSGEGLIGTVAISDGWKRVSNRAELRRWGIHWVNQHMISGEGKYRRMGH